MTQQVKHRPFALEFALGGAASCTAVLFTHPIETVKTRLQVQGELAKKGGGRPLLYRNALHALVVIGRNEGLRGLQGGLSPAVLYQLAMNGTRLGAFAPLSRLYGRLLAGLQPDKSRPNTVANVLAGATAGVLGAFVGSPFFLVKVRLQIQAKTEITTSGVVGHQHQYSGAWEGLSRIWQSEGVAGLYRGASASMLRVAIGSSVQLSTYEFSKASLQRVASLRPEAMSTHLASSLLAGLLVTCAMNPMDVVSTRLYNQPVVDGKGQLYTGLGDAMRKIAKTEGLRGFYKGFLAHYLRLGPHTILTFLVWEQLKAGMARMGW